MFFFNVLKRHKKGFYLFFILIVSLLATVGALRYGVKAYNIIACCAVVGMILPIYRIVTNFS